MSKYYDMPIVYASTIYITLTVQCTYICSFSVKYLYNYSEALPVLIIMYSGRKVYSIAQAMYFLHDYFGRRGTGGKCNEYNDQNGIIAVESLTLSSFVGGGFYWRDDFYLDF